METGHITFVSSPAIGLGTIAADNPPSPVSFTIAEVEGPWGNLYPGGEVEFERAPGTTIATRVTLA